MSIVVHVGVPREVADGGGVEWLRATAQQIDFAGAQLDLVTRAALKAGASLFFVMPGAPHLVLAARLADARGTRLRLAFGRLDERDQDALRVRRSALGPADR